MSQWIALGINAITAFLAICITIEQFKPSARRRQSMDHAFLVGLALIAFGTMIGAVPPPAAALTIMILGVLVYLEVGR